MWVAVTNINVFISFICFDSALNPNNFGLVEKFHTEQMLHVHLFVLLSRCWRHLISSCIIVISWFLVSFVMDLAIPSSIKALEKKLLLIFIFRVCLSTWSHKKFNLYQLLFGCNFLNDFLSIALKSVASNICFFNRAMVHVIEFSDRQRHITIFTFGASPGAVPAVQLYVKSTEFWF